MSDMNRMDYKLFVPRGDFNFFRVSEKTFSVPEILTVNIHLSEDKVTYWFYVEIPGEDEEWTFLLSKGKSLEGVLLIGNNPYEVHGAAQVIRTIRDRKTRVTEVTVSFVVTNAKNIRKNPRKEKEITRSELLDIDLD